jgi:hypothetical protein
LPFRVQAPDALLGLDWARPGTVDDDYRGFGWGFVPGLVLGSACEPRVMLASPLVLALHNAPPEDALESTGFLLEFDIDGERLHVELEAFLKVWLPRLPTADTVVLALCNPERRELPRPRGLSGGTRFIHALGDVESWGEDDGRGQVVRGLRAEAWRTG